MSTLGQSNLEKTISKQNHRQTQTQNILNPFSSNKYCIQHVSAHLSLSSKLFSNIIIFLIFDASWDLFKLSVPFSHDFMNIISISFQVFSRFLRRLLPWNLVSLLFSCASLDTCTASPPFVLLCFYCFIHSLLSPVFLHLTLLHLILLLI